MGIQLVELSSLDVSGANSSLIKASRPGTIHIVESFAYVTTLVNSTGSVVASLYSTANPRNDTTSPSRLNAFAGTITVTDATNTVVGVGTAFTDEFVVGDILRTNGGNEREIVAIASDTSMTVITNWGATESGVAYTRGTREIATLTIASGDFAVGSQVDLVVNEPTDSSLGLGREEGQPRTEAPFFNFVGGDTHTLTVTTAATTAGVVSPQLCICFREDKSIYPVS